jgi:steroid delta-isomerase
MGDIPSTAAYFKALNERNADALTRCFAARWVAHNPFGNPPYRNRGAAHTMLADLTAPWETLQVIPKSAYRSGNRVAIMWMAEGSAPGGHHAEFEGVTVFQLNEAGKITRLEGYWDSRATMKQLGDG